MPPYKATISPTASANATTNTISSVYLPRNLPFFSFSVRILVGGLKIEANYLVVVIFIRKIAEKVWEMHVFSYEFSVVLD